MRLKKQADSNYPVDNTHADASNSRCHKLLHLTKQEVSDDSMSRFDNLSVYAHVRLDVVKQLYGCSAASVWRHVKTGLIPAPKKFGARMTAWNVGDLRAALTGKLPSLAS